MGNVFDESANRKVPVTVVVDGKKMVIGEAELTPGVDGFVHVDMDLKTDDQTDVTKLFESGITGYSQSPGGAAHRMTDGEVQQVKGVAPHDHQPRQHRDAKPPWCKTCGLTADYQEPQSPFGKPADPYRR